MPIEKFSQIVPMPGQGLRVMKSKLLTALGATGVLEPYTANPERILERKILLQNAFNPNPSSGGGPTPPPSLPQAANLVLKVESSDFDLSADGTQVTGWNDHSGVGNNLDHTGAGLSGAPAIPTVSASVLCNGHHTVRFDGTMGIGSPNTFILGAPSGAEMMIVFVNDADPPTNVPANANGAFFQMCSISGCLQPFVDGNFYESFCQTARPSMGNPVTSTAGAFCCYDVGLNSAGTSINAWINSENFFSAAGGYTFSIAGRSPTTVGCWFSGATNLFGKGNVAAIYMWQVLLSAAERTQARQYITSTWGVLFP